MQPPSMPARLPEPQSLQMEELQKGHWMIFSAQPTPRQPGIWHARFGRHALHAGTPKHAWQSQALA